MELCEKKRKFCVFYGHLLGFLAPLFLWAFIRIFSSFVERKGLYTPQSTYVLTRLGSLRSPFPLGSSSAGEFPSYFYFTSASGFRIHFKNSPTFSREIKPFSLAADQQVFDFSPNSLNLCSNFSGSSMNITSNLLILQGIY